MRFERPLLTNVALSSQLDLILAVKDDKELKRTSMRVGDKAVFLTSFKPQFCFNCSQNTR